MTKKGLPGDKISELKNMDTDQMLSLLVENRLVSMAASRRVSDFIGDFNYLGYARTPGSSSMQTLLCCASS